MSSIAKTLRESQIGLVMFRANCSHKEARAALIAEEWVVSLAVIRILQDRIQAMAKLLG